jgi:formylglycine-generating enzyme required for sulfatase activity
MSEASVLGRESIDTAWHPLADGCPPEWATEWGQDRFGVFVAFTLEPESGEPVTQRLRWIPPGRFLMGSPEDETRGFFGREDSERARFDVEHPRHPVLISEGFWLFDTPCVQVLWEAVMGSNLSRFQSPSRPVEQGSWDDVQAFLKQINDRVPGLNLRLPSEAEWEYACRAGTDTALYTGPIEILGERNAPALDTIAWYGGNSGLDFDLEEGEDNSYWPEKQYPHARAGTRRVKLKRPNPWGLYDMLGNVWEWCADGMRDYGDQSVFDPVGPDRTGAKRVVRGGAWDRYARICRSAVRDQLSPGGRDDFLGFRCARGPS